jgi:hypothetical protein
MKFSTLILTIERVKADEIRYTSKTDFTGREYSHRIPYSSNFPYSKLKHGHSYATIAAKIEESWFWWISHDLTETETLIDSSFEQNFL